MNYQSPYQTERTGAASVPFDAGLRRHMLGIFNYMAIGLGITGAVALLVASVPAIYVPLFTTPLRWVVMLAPLAFVLFMSFRIERMSAASLRTAFFAFAAVMGASMASIFLVFTGASIARAFFIAAALFTSMSLWGYTTKRDLTKMGTFMIMGLVGLILASLINLLIGSTVLQMVVSLVGVIVFTGLTAFDVQRAKSDYFHYAGTAHAEKLSVMNALSLYLNLINLFQLLLSFTGVREE